MGTDCKSAAFQLRWFESTRAHQELQRRKDAGVSLLSETFQSISKGGFEQQRSRLQRRRAPPAAEAARSCWGRGQRYASKAQRMLGAATRPPAAETGRRGWGSAPIFQGPAKGLQKNRQAQLVRPGACPQKNSRRTESSMRRLFSFCWIFRKNYFTYSTVYSKPYSSCSFLTAGSQSSMKVGA